jgi:hypothetical protein
MEKTKSDVRRVFTRRLGECGGVRSATPWLLHARRMLKTSKRLVLPDALRLGTARALGKAAEGRRTPRRWRVDRHPSNCAERLGARQPSGALKNGLVAGAGGVTVEPAMKTPLHRAAKMGRINEIPRHLLTVELFMARDNSFARKTPLHLAAEYGQLDKVPKEFLTRETMTSSVSYSGGNWRGVAGGSCRTETPLHVAVRCGHADQIPKEFLTPEFLSIEAGGLWETVLHYLANQNRLDLVPAIYAGSLMWNSKNFYRQTPREVIEANKSQEAYVARVRSEPATEKQKVKLRWFGYIFDEKITKGEASDALNKCASDFPDKEWAYYNRPATEEQLPQLKTLLKGRGAKPENFAEPGKSLTYGQAKDLISELSMEKRHEDQIAEMEKISYDMTICEPLRWDEHPQLKYSHLKKAAKALDEIQPGWIEESNHQDLLLRKVAELYPGILAESGKY